jgi:hypothetical protein
VHLDLMSCSARSLVDGPEKVSSNESRKYGALLKSWMRTAAKAAPEYTGSDAEP